MRGAGQKFRVGGGDPRVPLQPYLPGSVVGECSMRRVKIRSQVTKVHGTCTLVTIRRERPAIAKLCKTSAYSRLADAQQGMSQRVDGKGDTIGDTGLAHQLGDMGLDRAFFDSQGDCRSRDWIGRKPAS